MPSTAIPYGPPTVQPEPDEPTIVQPDEPDNTFGRLRLTLSNPHVNMMITVCYLIMLGRSMIPYSARSDQHSYNLSYTH